MVDSATLGAQFAVDLATWDERKTDQDSCYLILRMISCKPHWYSHGLGTWAADPMKATPYADREEAYLAARSCGGLLHLYTRATGLFAIPA